MYLQLDIPTDESGHIVDLNALRDAIGAIVRCTSAQITTEELLKIAEDAIFRPWEAQEPERRQA